MDEERARDVTIYDVARAAGVAASTVSRTFSRPGREKARDTVDAATPAARAMS